MWRDKLRNRRARINQPSVRSKRIAKLAKLGFLALVAMFVLVLIAIPLLAFNLPSPDKIVRRDGFSTKILDRNGKLLYDIFVDERRSPVNFEDVPEYLKQATVSIEDKNFYSHSGFDPTGYFRAIYNIIFKRKLQGGSTLTQQLVKKALLTDDRTILRKINEFVITLQIEQKYSKDEILNMYFNEIPYGGTAWGVESAAEIYFGKKVKDLNLVESAFLAGLPQRPSAYSPYSDTPEAYIGRTTGVLRRMREDGHITEEQEKAAVDELPNLAFQPEGASFKAPHFVLYVKKLLEERYGENLVERGGLTVTTSLDLDLQEKAQQIVSEEIAKNEDAYHITNGAAIVLDSQTGEILSMVGSKDFNAEDYDGQVNVVLSDQRQPGSAIKPLVYVTGLNKGYTPSTLFMDVPTSFPGGVGQPDYQPVNYDGKYRGPIQFRYALGNSINVPAVKMMAMVGIKDVLQTLTDFGITTLPPTNETLRNVGLSLALGGGQVKLIDLTAAYSAFMNGGFKTEPNSILKVTDSSGKVLEDNRPQKGAQVVSPENAWLIANILSDNKAREIVFGANSLLNVPGRQVAVKTGTTNDRRDNWAVGGTPQLVVGTWVGNNDNTPMKSVASGISGASPIWRKILNAALEGKPAVAFEKPSGIVEAQVDNISGFAAHDGFPSRLEYFAKGTEPQGADPVHVNLKLCKSDGRLANPSDIAANNYDSKEYFIFKEEDPTAGAGGQNRWQEGILAWIATQNNPKYFPPTEFCGSTNPINVEFVSPKDRDSNLPNSLKVRIDPQSNNSIALVELEIDSVKVRSFSGGPFEYDATLTNGVHTLRAIAHDANGNKSDRIIQIGVNTNWDATPSPTP